MRIAWRPVLRVVGLALSALFAVVALSNCWELIKRGDPNYAVFAVLFGVLASGFGLVSTSGLIQGRGLRGVATAGGVALLVLGGVVVVFLAIAIANAEA